VRIVKSFKERNPIALGVGTNTPRGGVVSSVARQRKKFIHEP